MSSYTDLDVMQEKRVDDFWNVDSNKSLLWEVGLPRIRHSAVNRRRVNTDRAPKGLSVRERTTVKLERLVTENMCWWSVSGAARNETHVDEHQGLSRSALEPRVFA